MPKKKPETTQDIFGALAEALKTQAKRPNLLAYKPHPKQLPFHVAETKGRLYIGGNRSGKTTGGVVEDLWWARGSHPYRRVPEPPIRGRVVGVDFLNGVSKILLPEFARWCPPSLLKNGSWEDSYHKELRTLNFENGSFIEFMSYDQDLDKFAGTSRHFVHYDEEPPKHIFNENSMRLIDTGGDWWMTMTPVEGMTWIYDDIYLKGIAGEANITVVEADMGDNPYLDKEAIETALAGLDKDERKAREHGQFVQLGGLVFKEFNRDTHVIGSLVPPREWDWYASVDHGYRVPSAWLWHAVSPDNQVITFGEHYAEELTIKEHSRIIHLKEAGFGKVPEVRVGDPAMRQRTAESGASMVNLYGLEDIYIHTDFKSEPMAGVFKMNQYLKNIPGLGHPRWRITEDCPNLIRELRRLRWKRYASKKLEYENNPQEQIHKKDDHAPDSARYFFTLVPDLTPMPAEVFAPAPLPDGSNPALPSYDQLLVQMEQQGAFDYKKTTDPWTFSEGSDLYALEYE